MTPSKCKLPVNSIITKGFKKYQKIRWFERPKFCNNFRPKYKTPISARIIVIRITIKEPNMLPPAKKLEIVNMI